MLQDLVINLPRDHLKHMKVFLRRHRHSSKHVDRVVLLISPELKIGIFHINIEKYIINAHNFPYYL